MLGDSKKTKSTNGNKANQRKQRNIKLRVLEKLNHVWLARLCKEAWHIVKLLLETTAVLKQGTVSKKR